MDRRMITTDSMIPETHWHRLEGSKKLWEALMATKYNLITKKTKTFGKLYCVWYPNIHRQQQITITANITVEWGHTFEDNWLVLIHGLAGTGYARVTGIFSTPRNLIVTATKNVGMVQYALPVKLTYSR